MAKLLPLLLASLLLPMTPLALADDARDPDAAGPGPHDAPPADAARQGPRGQDRSDRGGGEHDEPDDDELERACRAANRSDTHACLRALQGSRHDDFEEALESLRGRPASDRLGHFEAAGDAVRGRFVSFRVDAAACALRDVTVQGVRLLDEVAVPGAGPSSAPEARGATFQLACGGARLRVHDNPAAVLRASAPEGLATRWSLHGGIDAAARAAPAQDGDEEPRSHLALQAGNFTALLRLDEPRQEGSAWLGARGHLVARAENLVVPGAGNRHRGDLDEAAARGRLGAEVTVLAGPGGPVAEAVALDDLALQVQPREDGVRVVVNATGVGGRTLVVNLHASMLSGEDLAVRLWDEVGGAFHEVPVVEAQGGLRDVLDPNDDSGPESWVVRDRDGAQVLLSVPRFSTKAFEVQSLPFVAEVAPSVLAGLLGGALLVAALALGLVRRRAP